MANSREILGRIGSIKDTMKITNAMYMISSAKLKKAKKNLENIEPHFLAVQDAIDNVLFQSPDIEHVFFGRGFQANQPRKAGYIVITADKGLAGAYNHNVIKTAMEELDKGGEPLLFVVGNVAYNYFSKKGIPVDTQVRLTVQNPTVRRARSITGAVIEKFRSGAIDEVSIVFTKMINAMESRTFVQKLLPLEKEASFERNKTREGDGAITYIPSHETVLDSVVPNIITGYVYGALVEAYSSEQNARMIAMESATKNAQDMLKELSIAYNRARQAAITQEITEVISGAKAQKRKKI